MTDVQTMAADDGDPARERTATAGSTVASATTSTQIQIPRQEPRPCRGVDIETPVSNALNSKDPYFMETSQVKRISSQLIRQAGTASGL